MLDDNDEGVGTHNVGLNKQPETAPPWPDFNFRDLTRLSLPARNQLAGIEEAARRASGLPAKCTLMRLSRHVRAVAVPCAFMLGQAAERSCGVHMRKKITTWKAEDIWPLMNQKGPDSS